MLRTHRNLKACIYLLGRTREEVLVINADKISQQQTSAAISVWASVRPLTSSWEVSLCRTGVFREASAYDSCTMEKCSFSLQEDHDSQRFLCLQKAAESLITN